MNTVDLTTVHISPQAAVRVRAYRRRLQEWQLPDSYDLLYERQAAALFRLIHSHERRYWTWVYRHARWTQYPPGDQWHTPGVAAFYRDYHRAVLDSVIADLESLKRAHRSGSPLPLAAGSAD